MKRYTLSFADSLKHVQEHCDIPFLTLNACLGDRKAAAKSSIDALITQHGPDRVNAILSSAPVIIGKEAPTKQHGCDLAEYEALS